MPIYRNADCWVVARANAEAARKEAQSKATQVNHERRELNRRLAEKLVGGWSAYEYRARTVSVQPRSFGADANAATAATEQRTKQRMTSFHSIKWNGEKA